MKQAILVRKDLKLGKGKLGAQVAHASLGAYKKADKKLREKWEKEGSKKVVLKVEDEFKLIKFQETAREKKLPTFLVIDAGLTQIPRATTTCLGVGPAEDEKIDEIVKDLKLL